jgi:dienelactone hydrolase
MSIAFRCDQCGKHYSAGDELAGKALKCKQCGKVMRIPGTPRPSPAGPKAAAPGPAKPAPAKAKESKASKPPPPPGLDLYGLDDEPAPGTKAQSEAFEEDEVAPLARAGTYTPPKPKKGKKGGRAKERERGGGITIDLSGWFGRGAFTVSFITAFLCVRWGCRLYRIGRAIHNASTASAEANPGKPRPPRKVDAITVPAFPDLGAGNQVAPGVMLYQVNLGPPGIAPANPGHRGKLWLYLPAGDHAPKSLPCILITGAGSDLITGMNLSEGDRREHMPYVQAGFAVLAYELDGALDEDSEEDVDEYQATEAFLVAQAGLVNAHNALEFLLAKVPQVDPDRLYAVGHSSAGTMALLFAENEPKIKACVAFAPAVDVSVRFPPEARAELARMVPGAGDLFTRFNPKMHESELNCPVFLFHAQDDSNVPVSESIGLAARLKQAGKSPTLRTVPNGDHYDGMLQQGIPQAIQWLKAQSGGAPSGG